MFVRIPLVNRIILVFFVDPRILLISRDKSDLAETPFTKRIFARLKDVYADNDEVACLSQRPCRTRARLPVTSLRLSVIILLHPTNPYENMNSKGMANVNTMIHMFVMRMHVPWYRLKDQPLLLPLEMAGQCLNSQLIS